MRKQVVDKNGKKYLVTVPSSHQNDGVWGDQVGTGSTPYILPFVSSGPPATSSVVTDSSITLTVYAGPSGPFDYIAFQWQTSSLNLSDGANYTGSRTNILTIYSASAATDGMYNVIVSNQYGLITSSYYMVTAV
jgi:hypothetical protein